MEKDSESTPLEKDPGPIPEQQQIKKVLRKNVSIAEWDETSHRVIVKISKGKEILTMGVFGSGSGASCLGGGIRMLFIEEALYLLSKGAIVIHKDSLPLSVQQCHYLLHQHFSLQNYIVYQHLKKQGYRVERTSVYDSKPLPSDDSESRIERRDLIVFDVWKSLTSGSSSNTTSPDYRLCVHSYPSNFPSLATLISLFQTSSPNPVLFAVVESSTVTFTQLNLHT